MENKRTLTIILSTALIILSIATFIICLIMNFPGFQQGGSIVIKSGIVTFSYATVWILVLIIGILIKSRGIVKYSIVFWAITLSTSVAMAYVNVVKHPGVIGEYICNILFPLILLFVGQWYGIRFFVYRTRFFVYGTLTQSIIVVVISLVMLAIAVIWLIYNKNKSE